MSVSLIATISEQPNDNHFNPSSVFSNDRNKISDVSITINNEYGVLDARGSVGHLTRNIKISS